MIENAAPLGKNIPGKYISRHMYDAQCIRHEREARRTDVERARADCRYMPAVVTAVAAVEDRALRRVEQLTHCRTGHGEVSREPVAEEDRRRRQ